MTTEGLLLLSIMNHLAISGGYIGLGVFVSSRFDAAAPTRALLTFRAVSAAFFICCALDHIDWAWHLFTITPVDMLNLFHLLVDSVQAISAVSAVTLALGFMSLRVFDRTYYRGMMDRAIDDEARRIVDEQRRSDKMQSLLDKTSENRDAIQAIADAVRSAR